MFEASIDMQTKEGLAALPLASKYGRKEICELLIKHGAISSAKNTIAAEAIRVAKCHGHL